MESMFVSCSKQSLSNLFTYYNEIVYYRQNES